MQRNGLPRQTDRVGTCRASPTSDPKGPSPRRRCSRSLRAGWCPAAARRRHHADATDSTPAALAAVRSGDADYACVPIENSIEGSVLPTLDSLATGSPLQIFAELTLDVAFTIVVRRGTAGRQSRDGRRLPGGRARRCGIG